MRSTVGVDNPLIINDHHHGDEADFFWEDLSRLFIAKTVRQSFLVLEGLLMGVAKTRDLVLDFLDLEQG